MKKLSTLFIILGLLIALYPVYQLAYTYYWENKLLDEMEALDQVYEELISEDADQLASGGITGAASDIIESDSEFGLSDTAEETTSAGNSSLEATTTPVVITASADVVAGTATTTANPPKKAAAVNAVQANTTQTQNKPVATTTKKKEITGTIGVLTISKINLKLPILAGITKSNLNKGAAWMSDSGVLGENGNAVISGHRGYTRGRLFNRLNEIKVNDTFSIKTKNGVLNYKVYEIKTVLPKETSVLSQPRSKEIVTLITCTPLYKSTHRLIIKAARVK